VQFPNLLVNPRLAIPPMVAAIVAENEVSLTV